VGVVERTWLRIRLEREQNMYIQKVMTRTVMTRTVGVSFADRQTIIAHLRVGDEISLVREPTNLYDPNAIKVVRGDGQQFGFVNRALAAMLAPILDHYKETVKGIVASITGGYSPFSFRGVLIKFDLPG
jgi:hypothetical protein